jgi:hypothetical protein
MIPPLKVVYQVPSMILTVLSSNPLTALTTVWSVSIKKLSMSTKPVVIPPVSFLTVPCALMVITAIVGSVLKDILRLLLINVSNVHLKTVKAAKIPSGALNAMLDMNWLQTNENVLKKVVFKDLFLLDTNASVQSEPIIPP